MFATSTRFVGRLAQKSPLVALCLSAALAVSCDSKREGLGNENETVLARLERSVGYPSGPWWNNPEQLNYLALSGAQIVITHSGVSDAEREQQLLNPQPKRSRAQALSLAAELRERLQSEPDQFAELAKRYSDDARTSTRGGRLGVVFASDLPPPLIDAFGNTKVGHITRIVETPAGFYILRRHQVPPAQRVSARHIVIKFSGATGWRRSEHPVARSRNEARELAQRVAAEASTKQTPFTRLLAKYTEAHDAIVDGDYGHWSTHERGDSVILAALASMRAGEISEPILALDGFHILQRTEEPPRPMLSTNHLVVSYKDAAQAEHRPPVQRSRSAARVLAASLLDELRAAPEKFEEVRRKHCEVPWFCRGPLSESVGRGVPGIDQALTAVSVGTVLPTAIESPLGFHIVRREDPAKVPVSSPPLRFDFSRAPPPKKDLTSILSHAPPEVIASETRRLAKDAVSSLDLRGDEATQFVQILERFAARISDVSAEERAGLARDVHGEIRSFLGEQRWRLFEEFQRTWLRRQGL